MLIRAPEDEFAFEDKYMWPDASEEAAVAGLLCLNTDEKPGMKKQPAKNQCKAQVESKRTFSLLAASSLCICGALHLLR